MTEAELLALVLEACRALRLRAYHTGDSRGSQPGFPDLVIVGKRVLYRELKSQTGRLSPRQTDWLCDLRSAGADAGIWRPEHWPAEITAELQRLVRM